MKNSLKKKMILALLTCFFIFTHLSAFSQIIWQEDFSTYANGATVGTNNNTANPTIDWTTSGGTPDGYFEVKSNYFEGRNLGKIMTWTSEDIDISSLNSFTISLFVEPTGGTMENTDYIETYYKFNGESEVLFSHNEGNFTGGTRKIDLLVGSYTSVQIIVKIFTENGGAERYGFDNIVLEEPPTSYFDDFESGLGNYSNPGDADFNWTRDSGGTPSVNTGPNSGNNSSTWYMFTESSSPNYPDKTANLTATYNLSNMSTPQLSFYYHMYGASMGTLYVDINDGTGWDLDVWSISGEQHTSDNDTWTKAIVDLSAYKNLLSVTVRFRGVTANSWQSDMAIDDIAIENIGTPYYSSGNNDPDDVNHWWSNTDGTGNHPSNFTDEKQFFIIQNGDTYTTDADWSVSGTDTKIQIEAGGSLVVNNNVTASCDIEVSGTFGTSSGNLSCSGDLSFDGSGNSYLPAGSYNNITLDRSSCNVTLNGNATITGILTLDNGIITTSTNYLLVDNTSTTAITGYSSASYINGNLQRKLLANRTGNANYIFPIGESSAYNPIELVDVNTGATTPVVLSSVTSSPAATTADGTTITNLQSRNWYTEIISGNFTNSIIRLTAGTTVNNIMGISAGQTGTYSSIGGTGGGATIESSSAILATSMPAYYCIGESFVKNYYTYQNGDWDDPETWTLDPSGTIKFNPTNSYPDADDNAYILNGRTVTATGDIECKILGTEFGGVLNLSTHIGTFVVVEGSGLIRIKSLNFPTGDFTSFVAAGGGTIEYYDVDGNLPSQYTYNNLWLTNSTASNNTLTLTNTSNPTNYTINGNIELSRSGTGTLELIYASQNSNTINHTVYGDYSVGEGCELDVRTDNNDPDHYLNCWGNFSNEGIVDFNNGVDYCSLDNTSGYIVLTFFGETDNTCFVNNTTRFYSFRVNKGTDQTHILTVYANQANSAPFKGYDNLIDINGVQAYPTITIENGTIKLKENIVVNRLAATSTNGYFIGTDINGTGGMWVDGAYVYAHNGNDQGIIFLAVYGKLRISAGTFDQFAGSNSSIILRQECELLIEGGTLNVRQIRPSNADPIKKGSYTQSGGTVNLKGTLGSGINELYPVFSLDFPDQVFKMSGGTLNINGVSRAGDGTSTNGAEGGLYINCDLYEVTGGTVNLTSNSTDNFNINSTAPFYNLNLYSTGNSFVLQSQQSNGQDQGNARPIVVLNDLKIDGTNGTTLITNNENVTVGGDFIIKSGATYTPGSNLTTLNGSSGQEFQINGTITSGLNDFTITNTSATVLTAASPTSLEVNGDFILDALCSIEDNGNTINTYSSVSNSGTHISSGTPEGKFVLKGGTTQQIYGNGSGRFGNLELDNGNDAVFNANQTVMNTLTLTDGVLDIGIYRLNLYNEETTAISVASPGSGRMIKTAGNQSDGGVLKVFSEAPNNTFTFPIGTATEYTPATITIDAATYGNIITKPVDEEQPFAIGTNNKLQYYWKLESEYFSAITNVVTDFIYDASDIQGTEGSYYAALYTPFFWTTGNVSPTYCDDGTNTIYFETTEIDGEYTAGQIDAFDVVEVFYSKVDGGDWDDNTSWSNDIDRISTATGIPADYNPVVIGGNSYNHTIIVDANGAISGSLIINSGSTLDLGTTVNHNFGALPNQQVGGTGTLRISSADALADFPAGDFGAFIGTAGGTVEYYTTGSNFELPTSSWTTGLNLENYFNLTTLANGANTITMPDIDLTIYNDFTSGSSAFTNIVNLNSGSQKDLYIYNDLNVNGGTLRFNNNNAQTLTVENDVNIVSSAIFEVLGANTAVDNSLTVYGNLTNDGTLTFKNGTRHCDLTFKGNTNNYFTGTDAAAITTLNDLTIDKGTTQSPRLAMNVTGALNTLTNNWLTISNGTFRFEVPSTTITVTDQANVFTIPASGCLSVNATGAVVNIGNIADNDADLSLLGKLEAKEGTINVGQAAFATNNDIEYASIGTPEISIETGGAINVTGQIRYSISTTTGSLIYNQTGGDLIIYGKDDDDSRAKFAVHNPGSIFNTSGGTITIKNGGGNLFGDVYLRPENSTVTGGTIIFDATTIGNQSYKINASCEVYNINLVGAGGNATTVDINVNDLVMLGSLSIDANSTLNSNDLDVYIGVDLIKSGTYNHGTNTTYFDGSGAQNITCNNATTFNNLTINKVSGTASLMGTDNPTTNNIFKLLDGTLDTKARNLYVLGNIENSATHVSSDVGAVILQGASKQYITGDGTGSFANLTLNNPGGFTLQTNLTITKQLTFQNGLFYIDDNLLTFSNSAPNPLNYNSSRFIITNGVASDAGVRKYLSLGNSNVDLPIGSLASSNKYTPAAYSLTDVAGTSPYLQVTPVNSKHIATTDPADKELKYYWSLLVSGDLTLSSFSQVYTYLDTDVQGTESSYVGGRLPTSSTAWVQDGVVDDVLNTISFSNITDLTGDYTAGESTEFADVCVYRSRQDGDWDNYLTWEKDCGSGYSNCLAGDYPQGNPVIIQAAHTVTTTANGYSSIELQLYGKLDLQNTTGHNFVTLLGDGWIRIEPNGEGAFVFPGGDNSLFMNTAGSTIEYSSAAGSTISPVILTYQNLVLSGAGAKSLANVDITINGDFEIATDCGQFSNEGYDKNITLHGDWINNSLIPYLPGEGSVFFVGNATQQITGNVATENFYDIDFSNSTTGGVELDRNINVANDLTIDATCKLIANTFNINIQGDWYDNSTTGFDAGTSNVTFDGSAEQTYYKVNDASFYLLTIDNSANVIANCNTNISHQLDFDNGKLDISSNSLNIGSSASITNFNSSRYVITNGLASDAGITKTIASSPYNFTFPLGTSTKYTPAELDESGAGGSGDITVINVDEKHPFASNNITDELQYYWIVNADAGIVPVSLTHTYTFETTDALQDVANYTAGNGYVAARFESAQWSPEYGGEAGTSITSPTINYINKNYINGEYTCGYTSNFGVIETYYSRSNAPDILTDADWRNLQTWSLKGHDDNIFIPNVLPNSNSVIIKEGHKVVIYDDGVTISDLTLDGELDINDKKNLDFGSITGTGRLVVANDAMNNFVLPTATLTDFTSATGGTIEYNGVGALPTNTIYNNIVFSGIGTKNLNTSNLIVNGDFHIEEGSVNNGNNIDITIKGNWIDDIADGGFSSNGGKVAFNGTSLQEITSNLNTVFYNLELDNSNGLTLNSPAEIKNNLVFINGKINTDTGKELYLSKTASNVVTGANSNNFVNGPLEKNISATGEFEFPIGSGTTYNPVTLSNADADIWQAQFYLGDYNSLSFTDPVTEVSNTEYWRIKSDVDASTAKITLPYGAPSGILTRWVLTEYSDATSEWNNDLGTTISTGDGTVTTNSNTTFNKFLDGNYFTIGSTNLMIWVGGVSTDWFDPNNWSTITVPTALDNVLIPEVDPDNWYPNIVTSSPSAVCNDITIEKDATLTISGSNTLIVNGDWINETVGAAGFIASDASTIIFAGTTSILGVCGNQFGGVNITGTLTAPTCNMFVSGDWTNTGTFNHNDATVDFNGTTTQTITSNSDPETFYNLAISGSDVNFAPTSRITVNNNSNISGTLTLEGNASDQSSYINLGTYTQTVTGTVNAERYVTGSSWHYMFPVLSNVPTTIYSVEGSNTNKNIYSYNEPNQDYWNATTNYGTTGWTYEYTSANIRTDKGFIFNRWGHSDKTFVQTGGELEDQAKSFTTTYTPHTGTISETGCVNDWDYYDGWNLVGNPYPSAVDWEDVDLNYVAGTSGIEAGVYYYDDSDANYKYYIQGGGVTGYTIGSLNANGGSRYVPSGQGFMVKAANSNIASTTFSIPLAAREHNDQEFWKGTDKNEEETIIPNIIRLNISQNGFADETVVRTLSAETGVTDGFDGLFDAHKMFSWDKTKPQIYTAIANDSTIFAINSIQEIEDSKQLPLQLYTGTNGEHTINFTENNFENVQVYLEDTEDGKFINTKTEDGYTFTESTGTNSTRFILHFNPNQAPVANGNLENQTAYEDEIFEYAHNISFEDLDLGDNVTVTVEKPDWLYYYPDTKLFKGVPENKDIGLNYVKLIATDILGAKTEVFFSIDVKNTNDAPFVTHEMEDITVNENFNIYVSDIENHFDDIDWGDELSYKAFYENNLDLPQWLSFSNNILSGLATNDAVGTHLITITATDLAGESVSADFNITILNANDAPTVIALPSDIIALEDNLIVIDYPADSFEDIDFGDNLTFTAENIPTWLTFNSENLTFEGIPLQENIGTYTIELTATDNSNESVSCNLNIIVENVNDAPTIVAVPDDITILEDNYFTLDFPTNSFDDEDLNDNLTFTATNVPEWLEFNSNNLTFEGTPLQENIGTYSIELTATDNSGESVSCNLNIIVENVNDAPTIVALPEDMIVLEDNFITISYPIESFDDEDINDNLNFTATNIPNWMSFDTENLTFAGMPQQANIGSYVIELTATDNSNESVSCNLNIIVENVNDAPIIQNPILDFVLYADEAFSYTFEENTFFDEDTNDNLSYSADIPEWLNFTEFFRTFSGTPTNNEAGVHTISLTAYDNDFASVTEMFDIIVLKTVDNLENETSDVMIYPNPSNGIFKIISMHDNYQYEITDMTGKVLRSSYSATQNADVDISEYSAGLYSLKLIYPDNRIIHKKIIIR